MIPSTYPATYISHSITLNTPNVVIVELAASIGTNVDLEVIEMDEDNKKEIIELIEDTIIESPDMKEIAMFVNHKVAWSKKKLLIAYNNLMTIKEVPIYFEYGEPTPEQPLLLPGRVLYRFCLLSGIPTDADDTLATMYEKILRYNCKRISEHLDTDKMIEICKSVNIENNYPEYDVDIESLYENFEDNVYLRNNYVCKTYKEAIVLAIMRFSVDISSATCPITEYNVLKALKKNYKPVDEELKYNYEKNPALYNISITFNPYFPRSFYKDIEGLAQDYGYVANRLNEDDPYTFLETSYLTYTWYRGWMPCLESSKGVRKATTIDLETKYDENNILTLVEGSNILEFDGECYFDTIETLTNHFRIKGLTCPFITKSGERLRYLTETEINRLLFLCQDEKEIEAVIKEILREQNSLKTKIERFKNEYEYFDSDLKDKIRKIFYKLLHASMYMRGWNGVDKYPLTSDAKQMGIDEAEDRSGMEIYELHLMIEELGKDQDIVLSMPLVRYSKGDNEENNGGTYEPSRNRSDGYTISERLFLLSRGNHSKNQRSCMRESSNWFAATCHMILKYIGADPGFDIREIEWIN